MPYMSGLELAQKLKAKLPRLPIVMISGCAALPPVELLCVDAHFGSGTCLDDLITTMRILIGSTKKPAFVCQWADST